MTDDRDPSPKLSAVVTVDTAAGGGARDADAPTFVLVHGGGVLGPG